MYTSINVITLYIKVPGIQKTTGIIFFVAAGLTENSMKIIRATFKNLSCKNKNKTQLTTLRESEEVKLLKKNMLIWHIFIKDKLHSISKNFYQVK